MTLLIGIIEILIGNKHHIQSIGWLLPLAGAAVSAGMGMMQNASNRRTQEHLMNMQGAQQISLAEYQKKMQLEMWRDTNYSAQVAEMKKAGLNPALLYGMGGGGGATTGGGIPSTSVPQPYQHQNVGELALQGANIALMKAQTEKTQAEAKQVEKQGVLTDQQQYGVGLDNAMKLYMQTTDQDGNNVDMKDSIAAQQKRAELENTLQQKLTEETKQRLAEKEIKVADEQINKMAKDIQKIAEDIKNESRKLSIEEQRLELEKKEEEFEHNWSNIVGKEAVGVAGSLIRMIPLLGHGGSEHKSHKSH